MSKKSRAIVCYIDGENQEFATLKDAKYHVYIAYTANERIRYFGKDAGYIIGIDKNDEVVSITEIKVDDNGNESFGRTKRY